MHHLHVGWDYLDSPHQQYRTKLLLSRDVGRCPGLLVGGHDHHVVGARVCVTDPVNHKLHKLLAVAGGVDGHEGLDVELDELLRQLLQLDQKVPGSPPVGCTTPQDLPENLLSQNSNPNCTGAIVCFRLIGQITAVN